MKPKRLTIPSLSLLLGASLSILPLPMLAQVAPTTPATPVAPAAPADDETIVLNPFVVKPDSTSGYYATETLSGTQLRTPVRDLANPITILTEEFMRDIGAVNYEEALAYLPSTREFTGDSSSPDAVAARTGTPYVVRGFTSGTLSNNFFSSRIKVDSYNTETLTQSRGPNSLLFGLGSVGGAIDATNKVARFNANGYGLETRFDSEGSWRATVDINQILIPKKLAVRFAALSTDQRTDRDLQYMRRNSGYLNLSIQPFKGATINVNAEKGRIDQSIPRPFLAYDSVSAWLNNARTPYEKANRIDNLLIASGSTAARNAARNALTGVTQTYSTNAFLVYIMNAPQLGVMNWKWSSRGSESYINGLNQNQTSLSELSVVPGVNFPLDTMVPGPAEHFDTTWDKYSASWQQQLLPKTYLEVAGAYEQYNDEDWQPIQRGNYEVFIDPNYYLPTQLASSNPDPTKPLNPYFGVPYLEGVSTIQHRDATTEQVRATLTHQFDLSRWEPIKGFDLGKFTLVGFYYQRNEDNYFTQPEEMTTTSYSPTVKVGSNTDNQIKRRYYLLPGQPVHFPEYYPVDIQKINQVANPAIPGGVIPAITSEFVRRLNDVYAPVTTKSFAAIGQWELFSKRLILTGGIRQDDITSTRMDFVADSVTGLFGGKETGTFAAPTNSSVKNHNFGAVVRITKWLDAFANTSTNTVAAGGSAFNIYNQSLPNQEGKGFDFGVRGFFLNDRVILKLNYFTNESENRVNNTLRDSAVGVELARVGAYVERYLDGMVYNGFGDKVAGAVRFAQYPGNGLWTDLDSDKTEGYEFEATLNPTKQLRIMLNVAYNDATLNATYKYFRPWYEQFAAPYRSDTSITSKIANPTLNATRTIGDHIIAFERRLNYHEGQVGGPNIRGYNWMVNLVGSYYFDQGPLKGTRVGGDLRWRDAPTIGYPEAGGFFDVSKPFKGAEYFTTNAFVSYSWKSQLLDHKTDWSVAFRVRNVLDQHEAYPNSAVDYGNGVRHTLHRIYVAPRTYELSVGLKF